MICLPDPVPGQAELLLLKRFLEMSAGVPLHSQGYKRTATQRELALSVAQMPTENKLGRKTVFGIYLPPKMQ